MLLLLGGSAALGLLLLVEAGMVLLLLLPALLEPIVKNESIVCLHFSPFLLLCSALALLPASITITMTTYCYSCCCTHPSFSASSYCRSPRRNGDTNNVEKKVTHSQEKQTPTTISTTIN